MSHPWATYTPELYHHGVKGQKWYIRRYQNEDGTLTEAGKKRVARKANKERKTGIFDDPVRKKEHVKNMHNEAVDRATFYGGKHVAIDAINKETDYVKSKNTARGVFVGASSAGIAAAAVFSSMPVVAVPSAAIGIGHSIYIGIKNRRLTRRAKEQVAYTKDVDFDPSKLKKY